ncbi:putative efflux system protein [Caenibius tardaugens NBRC 16725]|uniref:Putative efflux system protein n=1 Tax=Caenibius tardaugens NBRC 16725 TaxID=1219035 RepID=U2YI78_9SPHN|nr:HlyD family secretion protein [Caenibius tardaugens]AZI37018.1 HlyD family secretion protein [Caenibius tardaugens NBRC 16725]GAD47757.1 putative efflux system protein [Caenibius tardaugens NBRC 16725]
MAQSDNEATQQPDDTGVNDPQVNPPPQGWRPPPRQSLTMIAIGAIALIAILAILYAWNLPPFSGLSESTDNAYVRGKVTIISPQVSGYITEVPVQDFADVKKGQVLATIDSRIYAARVEQAKANLAAQIAALANSQQSQRGREAALSGQGAAIASAQAQLAKAQADMRRANALVADGSISAREHDQTRAALLAAQAAVQQASASRQVGQQDVRSVIVGRSGLEAAVEGAKAQLHLAEIDLANSVIRAPVDGQLSEIGVRNGAYVTAGTQLMFIVPQDIWVIANFKEAQTRQIRPGQRVTFRVDALGGATLTGRVQNLAPAAGSEFSVLKPDNATGNFVKVAQRIAVRIKVDPGQADSKRLRPGMSVEAKIETND